MILFLGFGRGAAVGLDALGVPLGFLVAPVGDGVVRGMAARTRPEMPFGSKAYLAVLQNQIQSVCKICYSVFMSSLLQIRNVSEEARRALKARAAARGESLNTYLLELVSREVERPTVAEVLARAAQRAERASVSSLGILDAARTEREAQLRASVDE